MYWSVQTVHVYCVSVVSSRLGIIINNCLFKEIRGDYFTKRCGLCFIFSNRYGQTYDKTHWKKGSYRSHNRVGCYQIGCYLRNSIALVCHQVSSDPIAWHFKNVMSCPQSYYSYNVTPARELTTVFLGAAQITFRRPKWSLVDIDYILHCDYI